MPVTVRIPTPLRRFAGERAEVPLAAASVDELLRALLEEHPALAPHLMSEDRKLRNFVNLFLNGEDVRGLGGLLTPLKDGDKVTIVPAIAGGVAASRT